MQARYASWIFITGLAGTCLPGSAATGNEAMIETGPSKTVCVGHFLVTVPSSADVRTTGSYFATTATRKGVAADFSRIQGQVESQAASLRADVMQKKRSPLGQSLEKEAGFKRSDSRLIGLESDTGGRQAVIAYHEDDRSAGMRVEVHKLIADQHYVFSTRHSGADNFNAVRDGVLQVADRYVPLKPGALPTQPGFCVGDGLFTEEGPYDIGGDATMVVKFKQYPAVSFNIEVSGLSQKPKESPLEERVNGDLGMLAKFSSGVKTLQRGKAAYGGQNGYEVGISTTSEDAPGTRMQKFFWGTEGTVNDPRRPYMEVELVTGVSGPSPIDDEQAEALWKQLMSSLRLRPGS